jgi:Septum formation initiator
VSATHSVNAHHRNHWMLPLAVITAAIMLVGWFPASALWHQQAQLNATANEIKSVERQEAILKDEAKTVDTKAAATQLARAQYQLVSPGQSLIQVLPGDAAGQVSANSVDPGFQPLVSPSSAATPGTTPSSQKTSTHRQGHGFVSRLVRTLEFWR